MEDIMQKFSSICHLAFDAYGGKHITANVRQFMDKHRNFVDVEGMFVAWESW